MERLTTLSDYVASLEIMTAKEYESTYKFGYAYEDNVTVLVYDGGHIVSNDDNTFTLNLYNHSFHSAKLSELEAILWDGYGKWEGQDLTEEELLKDLEIRVKAFQIKYNLPISNLDGIELMVFDSDECREELEYLQNVEYDLLDFINSGE